MFADEKETAEVYTKTSEETSTEATAPSKTESKLSRAQGLTSSEYSSSLNPKPGVGISDWLRMLLSLVFIVGLIFVLAWLVRRFNGGVLPAGQDIKVLSSVALSHKEKLITVQVEDQRMLLAVTPSGIQKLTTLNGSQNEIPQAD